MNNPSNIGAISPATTVEETDFFSDGNEVSENLRIEIEFSGITNQEAAHFTEWCGVKDEEIIKESMQLWYKQKAREIVIEKIEYYSKHFQTMPNSIKIKAQKTRWGSCTYKNDLALNYKLIMAPPDVLDYVVVHEMCHMEHKNHSKNFWNRVSSIMIDYKEKRNWLKEHGGKL